MSVAFVFSVGSTSQKTATVDFSDRGLNLLAHAQAIELDIGSECGGHGICGRDRLRFNEKDRQRLSSLTEAEKKHLTPAEISAGWRLGCQCFPEVTGVELRAESCLAAAKLATQYAK